MATGCGSCSFRARATTESHGDNPQRPGQLYGGADDQGLRPVTRQSRPRPNWCREWPAPTTAELRLGKVQREADGGKEEQGDGVQHEDGSQRDRHLLFPGIRTGPTAAMALPPQMAVPALIRSAGMCRTLNRRPMASAQKQGKADAQRRIGKTRAPRAHDFYAGSCRSPAPRWKLAAGRRRASWRPGDKGERTTGRRSALPRAPRGWR